jgi:hypothetical protein
VPLSAAGQDGENPRVAMDAAGDAVVVWKRKNGTNFIIEASSRAAGGIFTAPVPLSAAGQDAASPRLAMSAGGRAVAVWHRSNGTNLIVEAASFTAGGSWSAPVPLSAPGEDAEVPQVAMDAAGDAVAVWERFNGTNEIVETASLAAGGGWSAPVPLSAAGQDASAQRVAMDANGGAVAVWDRFNGTNLIVEAASRPAGGSFGAPVPLSAAGQDAEEPRIAMSAGGDAVAAWERFNGANWIVEAARRSGGGAFSAPVPLSVAGQDAEEPWVVMDAGGDAIAAWSLFNGTNTIIQARVNDATGPLLRNLAVPAGGFTGQPLAFSVSPFDAFSPIGSTSWSFGDGATAAGTSVTHAFAKPGTYSVTLTSADAVGNASSATKTLTIAQARARAARKAKVKGKVAQLNLSCLTPGTCTGTLTLSAKLKPSKRVKGAKRSKATKKRKTLQVGSARFSLAAGKRATVPVKLSRKGLGLLAKKGSLAVTVGGTGIEPGPVTLKVVKAKKKHGGRHSHHHAHR